MTGVQATADDLYEAYADNEVAGDRRFKGKVVEITGPVLAVKKYGDRPVVIIPAINSRGGVQCYCDPSYVAAASNIKPGQIVRLKGRVESFHEGVVIVEECMIK